jgi:hypothetical protein
MQHQTCPTHGFIVDEIRHTVVRRFLANWTSVDEPHQTKVFDRHFLWRARGCQGDRMALPFSRIRVSDASPVERLPIVVGRQRPESLDG